MLAVDTNVLIYAADVDSQFDTPCRNWLERQRAPSQGETNFIGLTVSQNPLANGTCARYLGRQMGT